MAEPAVTDVSGGAIPLSPAAAGGRRGRKLKLVTRKAARKALKKMGLKMRGGAGAAPVVADSSGAPVVGTKPAGEAAAAGGRRRTRKHHRKSRRSFF
jgi:hypothetical protein